MQIDRQRLLDITEQATPRLSGVEALMHSIHREPGLREQLTLETFALSPVPTSSEGRWVLLSLLTTAASAVETSTAPTWRAPWAAVEWTLAEQTTSRLLILKEHEDTAQLIEEAPVIPARPADFKATLEPLERTLRAKALYQALDALLAGPPVSPLDLRNLAGHYAGLLPLAVYPYYWTLLPESCQWLRPDAPSPSTN